MTTALPPNGSYSTPPNGRHSPKPVQQKENSSHSLQALPGQTLTKTIKVYLDANLAEISDPSKKINGQVEKIPTVNEILNWIVQHKEDIICEEGPGIIKDMQAVFASLVKLEKTSFSFSLVNFKLLDALYIIADKMMDLKLPKVESSFKYRIIAHCSELATHYQLSGGEKNNHFLLKQKELFGRLSTKDPWF